MRTSKWISWKSTVCLLSVLCILWMAPDSLYSQVIPPVPRAPITAPADTTNSTTPATTSPTAPPSKNPDQRHRNAFYKFPASFIGDSSYFTVVSIASPFHHNDFDLLFEDCGRPFIT
jgi:hypothetical protein